MSVQVTVPSKRLGLPTPWIAGLISLVLIAALVPVAIHQISMSPSVPVASRVLAGDITSLDPVNPLPKGGWPKAPQAAGGMFFVRCTNLWTALPDGSSAHKVFSMPGLASPTISSSARTLAFFGTTDGVLQLWMAGSDGSQPHPVARISEDGAAVPAQAQGLTWSPDDSMLAFALTTPGVGAFAGGSSIWVLHLASGSITRVGTGWPVPTWDGKRLAVAEPGGHTTDLMSMVGFDHPRAMRSLADPAQAELAVGVQNATWYQIGEPHIAVLLRQPDGDIEVAIRSRVGQPEDQLVVQLEGAHRFDPTVRPAVAPDGLSIVFGTIDAHGQRDLATLDMVTHTWHFSDYAWDPVWSPVVPQRGSVSVYRAVGTARAYLSAGIWGQQDLRVLSDGSPSKEVTQMKSGGYVLGDAHRRGDGWVIGATIFGERQGHPAYAQIAVDVSGRAGRVAAGVHPVSPVHSVRTIGQADTFLRSTLTVPFLKPAGLPSGSQLASPMPEAWGDYGGHVSGSMRVSVPTAGGGKHIVTFSYGQGGFGCGSDPVGTDVDGTSAATTSPRSIHQWNATPEVVWPAKANDTSGPYSVAGNIPRRLMFSIATAMEQARRNRPA